MRSKLLGFLLLASLFSVSCDDEEVLPAYRQDLVELTTGADGIVNTMFFDDGSSMKVLNKVGGKLTRDSLYRVRALYWVTEEGVELQSAQVLVSSYPVPREYLPLKTDPVELKSSWGSRRYINFLLGIKTGGGKQVFAYVDNGIEVFNNGKKKLKLELYHDQQVDPLYYTEDAYFSCPIYHYEDKLEHGKDSVEFTLCTFDGLKKKSFLY